MDAFYKMAFRLMCLLAIADLIVAAMALAPSQVGQALTMSITNLTWTGRVLPGQPQMTFTGTAEIIIPQILGINPSYLQNQSTKAVDETVATKRNSDITCESSLTAPADAVRKALDDAKKIQNGKCEAEPARRRNISCAPLSCYSGAALFLCNRQAEYLSVGCKSVIEAAERIAASCAQTGKIAGEAMMNSTWYVEIRDFGECVV